MVHCCIGIMAYNEEANIGGILEALLAQETTKVIIDEIIVVASGCTDHTVAIVETFVRRDKRVRLLTQAKREGKASAVNLFLKEVRSEVIVLESADTLPVKHAIEALVSPFEDPLVGMVGGRPVPTNSTSNMMGWGVRLLWELHHQLSLRTPKMGELIAFRNIFRQIPSDSAVDEASIEPLIVGQGMQLKYAPAAVVLNRGPESMAEYVTQRRRIYAGHLYVRDTLGYRVATMNGLKIALLYLSQVRPDWRYFVWGPVMIALEMYVRWLGFSDYVVFKRKPYAWTIVESTKKPAKIQ
jgi:poly-beta-1,6-N-acetyl-D-glucosamine synthase